MGMAEVVAGCEGMSSALSRKLEKAVPKQTAPRTGGGRAAARDQEQ